MTSSFKSGFKDGIKLIPSALALVVGVWWVGGILTLGYETFQWSIQDVRPHSLTCYNSVFEITYMSPQGEVLGSKPNQYGVWTLKDGTYIQNSGETCIAEKSQVEK